MTKRLLFSVLALCMFSLMTSCLKNGMDDFEGIKHPFQVHGSFDPKLGIPVGQAEMTVKQMLTMLNVQNGMITYDEDSHLMSVKYQDTSENHFDFDQMKSKTRKLRVARRNGSKDGSSNLVVLYSDLMTGSMEIDLFNNLGIANYNLLFNGVKASMSCNLKGEGTLSASTIHDHGLYVYIDSLQLHAYGRGGNEVRVPFLDSLYSLQDFMDPQGQDVTLLDNTDVTALLNIAPTGIRYTARINLAIDATELAFWGLSMGGTIDESFISDSLQIDAITATSIIGAEIPLALHFENMSYESDINFNFGQNIEINGLEIDNSYIGLEFENGTPLVLEVDASFTDSLGNVLAPIVDNVAIEGATIRLNPNGDGSYIVSQPTRSMLQVPVNAQTIRALTTARNIHITATASTSTNTGTGIQNNAVVSIQDDNKLKVRAFVVAHPNIDITIPITGTNDDENNQ